MGRGGKVGRKGNSRKRGRSNEASSDDSDEDYVVSDEEYSSSLDELASEEEEEEEEPPRVRNFSRSKAKNGICGWQRNVSKTSRKRGKITYEDEEDEEGKEQEEEEKDEDEEEVQEEEEDDEYKVEEKEEDDDEYVEEEEEKEEDEDEDEDEENEGIWNSSRSKARNGVYGQPKNASKTSTKKRGIRFAEPLEEDEEEKEEDEGDMKDKEEEGDENHKEEEEDDRYKEEEEDESEKVVEEGKKDKEEEEYEEEKVEREGDGGEEEETGDEWKEEEDGDADEEDEDFDCDDDDEFTPEEDDYSDDEEEEMRGRGKNNNGMTKGRKVSQKRASVVSSRGRKKRSSRASKRPSRNKKRRNGRIRITVKSDDEDDFIDNDPTIRTASRDKQGRKRRRVLLSDSDCVSSGSPDVEYTISEEEREQVREANELCGGSRINLRSSSLLIKNEEDGVHEDLRQQRKPPGRKGKEKIEEPQGRKGKEKVEDFKSEVAKQVCGICLSEENKRRVRGVLNCCTHYFCFACIMEWAKVESRCPLCKQRFITISKPARSTGIDLREVVIHVPERDQVYQPSEEELRSYIDPYEHVICSECHQGGDDGLMLLCDICDSPAHTYCVGLGREVPEGNWYCDGCRPVALGSSGSEVQERVAEQRVTIQSLPVRPPAIHVRESIDLNSMSSPRVAFTQGFGHLPSSRFTGRSVEGASPVSGGAPTLSERRWIHRQIQQLLSIDRLTSTTGRTNAIPATSSTSNLYNSQIDQSREIASEHAMTQDVGTSYHTFFEETLCNNTSPLIQNGALWPGLVGSTPVLDCEQIHQFSRSNIVIDDSFSPGVREESNNFQNAKEQLQSMVKNHLKSLSQNIDLGHNTIKDIARSSMHTILAACGLEHMKSEVCFVPPPAVCSHIELNAGGQTSLIKGCCSSCFDSFVGDVVKRILDTRVSSQWLRLGL